MEIINKTKTMENKPINKKILGVILGVLVIVFGGFIVVNEFTLVTGEEVFLKTLPVDPRDLLRGDYVILSYTIEREPSIQTFISQNKLQEGDEFYIGLHVDNEKVANFEQVSTRKPDKSLSIKAKVGEKRGGETHMIDLGIGKYFVPEGRGHEIERLRGNLKVLVSIDTYGVTKIKDIYHDGVKIDFRKKPVNN